MTKTNRIYKENYSIRPSTIFKKGWALSTRKVDDSTYVMEIIVDTDSSPLKMVDGQNDYITYESHEKAQLFVNENTPFTISPEFRDNLLTVAYGNKVLEYTFEDGKILATWNQEKSDKCFFTLGEIMHYEKYANLDELEGKTVNEVVEIISYWGENAYDDSMQDYANSYFRMNGNVSSDDCSTCGGGGCVHCSPKDFI